MVERPEGKKLKQLPDVIHVSDLSQATVDILKQFGMEAPTLLNDYAVALEDALIEQVKVSVKLTKENKSLKNKQNTK